MESEALGAAHSATEFSLLGLFMMADIVVKAVMAILVICSIWSWGVAFDRMGYFGKRRKKAALLERALFNAHDFKTLEQVGSEFESEPAGSMIRAVVREMEQGSVPIHRMDVSMGESFSMRADRVMRIVGQRRLAEAESGLGVLASIGSAAPFIGLFGTVWGIMNSFRAIALSRDTNLAVVAPGIAEALFATALGLVAAIPAVIFFNKFSTDAQRLAGHLDSSADHVLTLLSRLIEQRSR